MMYGYMTIWWIRSLVCAVLADKLLQPTSNGEAGHFRTRKGIYVQCVMHPYLFHCSQRTYGRVYHKSPLRLVRDNLYDIPHIGRYFQKLLSPLLARADFLIKQD